MAIREMFLPEFDQEMAQTRKLLEKLPERLPDYKPHPKSMSLSRLAGHVAELPYWAEVTMTTEELVMDPTKFQPFEPETRQEVLDKFDKSVAGGRAAIAAATDESFHVTWSFKTNDGHTVFALPRVATLRSMVLNHLIHHRAQLGVYLRLNNIEFPGMYGPSADEMKFWEASARKTA